VVRNSDADACCLCNQTVYARSGDGISEIENEPTSEQIIGENRGSKIKGGGEILSGPQSHVHL